MIAGFFFFEKNDMKRRVAIQGTYGCFHDLASHLFFKNEEIEIVECASFKEEFKVVKEDESMYALVAIENTIAGSLLQNYELLLKSGLTIVGEHKLRIKHCLCALEGQKIEDLHEVISHPVALMQCGDFLDRNPHLRVVEGGDTAGSAKKVANENLKGVGVICSTHAAKLYGLNVIEDGIETNKHNFTRFLVLAHKDEPSLHPVMNKSSIAFAVPHASGALSKILTILSFYDINLTKIQSNPIIGKEWEYFFYVDLCYEDYERYCQAILAIKPLSIDLRILGNYVIGEQTI